MEIIQGAWWYEPGDRDKAMYQVRERIEQKAREERRVTGPINWRDLPPDSEELTDSPPVEFGPGTMCLLGEAMARPKYHVVTPLSGFTHELEKKDLETLRAETRKALDASFPFDRDRSNARVDAVINEIGPETAMKTLEERK